MNRPSPQRRRITALAGIAVVGALIVAPPVSADADVLGLSVTFQGQEAIYIDVCFNTTANLPATMVLDYTISSGATVVAADTWDGGTPGTIFVEAPTCPGSITQFASTNLTPATAYTVRVTATLTPMVEDASFELAPDPAGYPAFSTTSEVNVTTLAGEVSGTGGGGGSGGDGSPTSGAGVNGGGGTATTPAGGGSTPSTAGATTGEPPATPVVISNPGSFRPSQLSALTPREVASIAPSAFGLLTPAAFAAISPGQAAVITPVQASAIRPARAAQLTPGAVAALDVESVVAMRPRAVGSLSVDAVRAMTSAQLKALTPRQVGALRPEQVARLTVAQKALLRR